MQKTMEDQLELELNVNLEEYKAKMSDITAEANVLHQTFALTITAIGFVLAATPFVVQFQVPLVFIAASLVFYGLTLTQLRHSWTVLATENYIAHNLRPAIQEILITISPKRKQSISTLLLWSAYGSRSAYTSHWLQFPIEFARYLIPVSAGLCCCGAYWVTPSPRNELVDIGILVINILATGYIVIIGLNMRNQLTTEKNLQKNKIAMYKKKKRK